MTAYAVKTEDTASEEKRNVMASLYLIYDFATKVGGDKFEVRGGGIFIISSL